MNQYIKICYKPDWHSNPNYWELWFYLNGKIHREEVPSWLDSRGSWGWYIHDEYQKHGRDFNWDKE